MAFTTYAKNGILNELTGQNGSAFDFSDMYLALGYLSGASFVELDNTSCPGYTRKLVGSPTQPLTRLFPIATEGMVSNNQEIQFTRATASWTGITITHAALYTASTGGNQITLDALTSSLSGIGENWIVALPAGSCVLSFN